jgi:hypothetical protein
MLNVTNELDKDKNIINALNFFAKSLSIELSSSDKVLWTKTYTDYYDLLLIIKNGETKKILHHEYKLHYNQNRNLKPIFPDPVADDIILYEILPEKDCRVTGNDDAVGCAIEFYEEIEPFGYCSSGLNSTHYIYPQKFMPLEAHGSRYFYKNYNKNIVYKNITIRLNTEQGLMYLTYTSPPIIDKQFIIKDNRVIVNPTYCENQFKCDNDFLEYVAMLYNAGRVSNCDIIKFAI